MKLIVELIYILVWFFIKTGETVQKFPAVLLHTTKRIKIPKIHLPTIKFALPIVTPATPQKIHKKKILFKAKRNKKTPSLFTYFKRSCFFKRPSF